MNTSVVFEDSVAASGSGLLPRKVGGTEAQVRVVPGIVNDTYILLVSGKKPYVNMTVRLYPLSRDGNAEFNRIEVRAYTPGIAIPVIGKYEEHLPLDGIRGSKGIELIWANGLVERIMVPTATSPSPCGTSTSPTETSERPSAFPRVLGESADQSYLVTPIGTLATPQILGNNCGTIKQEIEARFDVVRFGKCSHPLSATADVEAAELVAEILASGAVLNVEFGHRTVKNKSGLVTYNTFLAYAGGDRP